MLLQRVILSIAMVILAALFLSSFAYSQSRQPPTAPSINQPERASTNAGSTDEVQHPPTEMERTAGNLKWFFTALVYPALVGAIFLLLVISIIYIIGKGNGFGYVRRITGALLPLLMLTFMLLVTDKGDDPIKSFFLWIPPFLYLIGGTAIGIILIEFGRRFMNTDDDRWGSVYNIFLSLMVVFILYSIMKGFLDSLFYFLFAMIMAGGLDIVFRGQSGPSLEIASPMISGKRHIKSQRERVEKSGVSSEPDAYSVQPDYLSTYQASRSSKTDSTRSEPDKP